MVLTLIGAMAERPTKLVHVGFEMVVMTVGFMVGMRHMLRQFYLKPYLDGQALQVQPQWSVIAIFVVLFVGGLAVIAWMGKRAFSGPRSAFGKSA